MFPLIFRSTVEEIELISSKLFKFQRFDAIKEFTEKTILPPPFVIFEYTIHFFKFASSFLNGTTLTEESSFRKASKCFKLINNIVFS